MPPPSAPSHKDVVNSAANALNDSENKLLLVRTSFSQFELLHEAFHLCVLLLFLLVSGSCHRHDGEKAESENDDLHVVVAWLKKAVDSSV